MSDHSKEPGWNPDYRLGEENERRRIVAWLRSEPYQFVIDDQEGSDYAAAIERGEHLRGDDE